MAHGVPCEASAVRSRILFVAKSDGVGGVERKIAGLVSTLAERHVVCDLVTLAHGAGPGLLVHISKTVLEVRVSSGPIRRLLQLFRLRRIIAANRYDAVIGFGPSSNALVALANRSRGPQAVIVEVGDPFIERRRHWNRWWMWSYRRADVIVVLTDRLASELRAVRSRPRRIVVIPNMVAPTVPFVDPARPRQLVVAGLGRLVQSKRYSDLIEAFARLGPSAEQWRVVLIGDGEDRLRIERRAAELGIGHRVEFTGWRDCPWEILSESSIFVACSGNEGFATVLIEAAASGCALISSDCRFGPREILQDGRSGVLYPVGDVDNLSEALGALIADPVHRLALACAAHERAGDFDPSGITDAWIDLIGVAPTT